MSSPFKVFRKYQKVLLVIAGLMAMIAFVVLPIVLQNLGMRQGSKNPVVVTTTKYGDLTQRDLQNLHYRHECVVGVLSAMAGRLFGADEQAFRPGVEMMLGDSKEENLVQRWLMDKKADEIGLQVSDESVTEFLTNKNDAFLAFFMRNPQFARYLPYLLQNKSLGKLTAADFKNLFARFQVTQPMFYDMLRDELKAQEFVTTFERSVRGMPPGQRWDYFCRTQQRAKIECLPVPVASFAAKIEKPSENVLEDYFNRYKDNVEDPYSPEPGFRVPEKIEVEYFQANIEDFAAPEKITDDEIQAGYEKDPKRYDELNKSVLLREAEKSAEKKEGEKQKPAEKESAKKESTEQGKPAEDVKPAENAKPAEEAKPAENAKPAEEAKPVEGGTPPVKTEGEKKEEKKDGEQSAPPAAEKPADKPADKAEEKSSSVRRSPYRFASFLADDEEKKAEPPKEETSKVDAPKEEPAKPETAKADASAASAETAAPKAETSTEEKKPADAKPAENKPAEAAGQPPKSPSAAGGEQAAPPRRQLTEEVRKVIRRRVAEEKILAIFAKLEVAMKENASEWRGYKAAKLRDETGLKEPPRLDFASLAKPYGITAGKTGEVTRWQARDMEVGKSLLLDSAQHSPLFIAAFDNLQQRSEILEDTPVKTQADNLLFLLRKTKDIKEQAAKWSDANVQQQVLEAWRLEQARAPALQEAQKLAAEAKKGKATLKETFAGVAGREVASPPAFTWMIGGMDPYNPQYRLNMDIEGVQMPGEEFMQTVFGLSEKGIGTALNMPKTIAYVVQAEKFEPTSDELWNRFKDYDFNRYANAAMGDLQAAGSALVKQLREEAGLKWQPKADQTEKEPSPGS